MTRLNKTIFIERLALYMGEVNALHPFKEGNGRASRLYFKQISKNAGYTLEFHKASTNALLNADIAAFNGEYGSLVQILGTIVSVMY